MRESAIVLCLLSLFPAAVLPTKPAVTKAWIDHKGAVHVLTTEARDHVIYPEKWQDGGGFESIAVAPDRRTVGWLADQLLTPEEGGTSYSYPVALQLDIWRDGHVIRKIGPPALAIQNWIFVKNGSEVAFHFAPPHGIESYNCMLFAVNSGRELAHWSRDRKDRVVPVWAKPLLSNDPPSQEQQP